MSDLQISLIAIGALIILVVLVINWWQERRLYRQMEKGFSSIKHDALLGERNLAERDLAELSLKALNLDEQNLNNQANNPLNSDQVDSAKVSLAEPSFDLNALSNTVDKHPADNFVIDSVLFKPVKSEFSFTNQDDQLISPKTSDGGDEVLQEKISIDTASIDATSDTSPSLELGHLSAHVFNVSNILPLDASANHGANPTELLHDAPSLASENLAAKVNLPSMLNAQMDLTAVLYLAAETSISILNNALIALFEDFDKPVFVHVLDTNHQWHLLQEAHVNSASLVKVACSIQLADRGGAVAREVLNRFQLAVETLGLEINAHLEWQDAEDVLAKANALDAFCIEVDKTIGFHLQHGENGAFTGTKLRGLAEAQGLTLSVDGQFKCVADGCNTPSFVMFNRDGYAFNPEMLRSSVIKGVTFQLDIPHVKQSAEAFNQMVQVARQMEIGLNAVLVDDHNKTLSDLHIEKIRQQLKVIQATMLVRGIVPGSEYARRLFS